MGVGTPVPSNHPHNRHLPVHQSHRPKGNRKRSETGKKKRKAKYHGNRIWHCIHMAAVLHNRQSTQQPEWSNRPAPKGPPNPGPGPPLNPSPHTLKPTHPVCLCLVSQLDKQTALEHLAGRVAPQAHSVERHASRPEVVNNRVQGGKHWTEEQRRGHSQAAARQPQQDACQKVEVCVCLLLATLLGQPHQLTRPCSHCLTLALSLSLTHSHSPRMCDHSLEKGLT